MPKFTVIAIDYVDADTILHHTEASDAEAAANDYRRLCAEERRGFEGESWQIQYVFADHLVTLNAPVAQEPGDPERFDGMS